MHGQNQIKNATVYSLKNNSIFGLRKTTADIPNSEVRRRYVYNDTVKSTQSLKLSKSSVLRTLTMQVSFKARTDYIKLAKRFQLKQ